jgi:diguanylate cyclase (GGDEF)-like protein
VLLVCAPVFAALYLMLPAGGPAQLVIYPVFGFVATLAILAGIRLNRTTRPGAWRLSAGGLGLLAIGDVVYTLVIVLVPEITYPTPADVPYLLGYGALVLGVRRLVSGRMAGGDRVPMLDGAILAAGAGSVFWMAVIRPTLDGQVDTFAATVSLTYPCLDLVLLGLALRVLLASSAGERSIQILAAGLLFYFAADVIYAAQVLDGAYTDGSAVDAGWIVGITLLAVAALHPSAANAVSAADPRSELGRRRLSLLAVAAMIAPAFILLKAVLGGDEETIGLIVGWTILFGLVLVRLASTVDELRLSLLQRRRLQDDLRFQAEHDPLTRLANRALFERMLAQAMRDSPATTGLVFLDLDDFKAINDTLGHASGDDLLRVVADRIQRDLRPGDVAARLGGDEFAIVLADCPNEAIGTLIAERVLAALRAPVLLAGRQLQVRASAGVAIGRVGATPMELMSDADIAMYRAKAHGKDKAEAHESEAHNQVVRGYELRTELADAIHSGQFFLLFQPAISTVTEELVGAEALVRWRHPSRGVLTPAEFIPHAESSGLINELGRWILREACAAAADWPARTDGTRPVLSVNLSADQLHHPEFVEEVRRILSETGLPASRLVLEVTESALVDFQAATETLHALRARGIRLALDDFGTGYSALSYLAKLPFDVVKIDRGFIGSLGQDRRVEALLGGIVGLCRGLELRLCAEGIETDAQLEVVRRHGIEVAQGYLIAEPLTSASFAALIDASTRAPVRGGRLGKDRAPSARADGPRDRRDVRRLTSRAGATRGPEAPGPDESLAGPHPARAYHAGTNRGRPPPAVPHEEPTP